jgi:hypothetical protein
MTTILTVLAILLISGGLVASALLLCACAVAKRGEVSAHEI